MNEKWFFNNNRGKVLKSCSSNSSSEALKAKFTKLLNYPTIASTIEINILKILIKYFALSFSAYLCRERIRNKNGLHS